MLPMLMGCGVCGTKMTLPSIFDKNVINRSIISKYEEAEIGYNAINLQILSDIRDYVQARDSFNTTKAQNLKNSKLKYCSTQIRYYDGFIKAVKELKKYKDKIKRALLSKENEAKITIEMRQKITNDEKILDSDLPEDTTSSSYTQFFYKNNIKSLITEYNKVLDIYNKALNKLNDINNKSDNLDKSFMRLLLNTAFSFNKPQKKRS